MKKIGTLAQIVVYVEADVAASRSAYYRSLEILQVNAKQKLGAINHLNT